MKNSKIEWCDHTFNPWIGCSKVSPACDNCYAEHLMSTRLGRVEWGAGADRQRTSIANWRKPLLWDKEAAKTRKRTLVFCASLADVFDNEVDDCWRRDLFALIEQTPNLTWLLLTKRIGNVIRMTDGLSGGYWLPPNAALGATMANQAEYDRDSLKLREAGRVTGAMFTFGSFEPLLGPVVLGKYAPSWVIAGGESGPDARPMNPAWARSLRDQCARAGTAFFMKQLSGPNGRAIKEIEKFPSDLQIRDMPQ